MFFVFLDHFVLLGAYYLKYNPVFYFDNFDNYIHSNIYLDYNIDNKIYYILFLNNYIYILSHNL